MPTTADIETAAAELGFTWSGDTYPGKNTIKMDFVCENGHEIQKSWCDLQAKKKCRFCSRKVATSDEQAAILEQLGFTYKDTRRFTDPKGRNRVTLVLECGAGHPLETTMVSLKRAIKNGTSGCRHCPK